MNLRLFLALLVALSAPAFAEAPTFEGPDHSQVDILRIYPGGPKLYVQATLPDGEPGIFLVDTGADISVLTTRAAARLGLQPQSWIQVEGMSGTTSAAQAMLTHVTLGNVVVPEVEVAFDVAGVGDTAGWMRTDGILGNNVWSRFVLELDYRANVLALHRPGTVKLPRGAPLQRRGGHILTPVEITTSSKHRSEVWLMLDTGASDLMLSGAAGDGFVEGDYSEGIEPIMGVGAADTLPPSFFLQRTRRIPVSKVRLGGRRMAVDLEARWLNYDTDRPVGPTGMTGLVGHDLLEGRVVWIDYGGGRVALSRSKRAAREVNGHQVLLDADLDRFGDDPSRGLLRAKLNLGINKLDEATDLLTAYLAAGPFPSEPSPDGPHDPNAEARVLLANVYRSRGDLARAWDALAPLEPGALVDEREIVAAVNGLLLDARMDEAEDLARSALLARPKDPRALAQVALADVLLAQADTDGARDLLLQATHVVQNPDAYLMRRARVAQAAGDRNGAMSLVRRQLHRYPFWGQYLWFYAMLLDADLEVDTFRADLDNAMGRIHPAHRPLEFLVAAYHVIGDQGHAIDLMHEGVARDCSFALLPASHDNCMAWYWSLAGTHADDALASIQRALGEDGDRPDFLDTKAMVHLARGEAEQAHVAALAAARMAPDDVYMLWQAERITELVARYREAGGG